MDNLITTIGIAFVFIALAVASLAIGWIITGKNRIKGSCGGKRPTGDGKDCESTGSCELCDRNKKDDKK